MENVFAVSLYEVLIDFRKGNITVTACLVLCQECMRKNGILA